MTPFSHSLTWVVQINYPGSANKLSSNLPLGVVWDEEMSSKMGMPSDLLQQLACGSKGTDYIATHANQIKFKVLIASIVAAHTVFNGMCPQVTWDAEKQLGINTHKGLLKQLALGKSYMDEEKTTHIVKLNTSEVLTHVGDQMHANLGMDGDYTSGLDTHADLLQQLAWGRVVLDYEMGESITETVLANVFTNVDSLTVTIDYDKQLSDQVCKPQLFVDAYLTEVKHKETIISRRRWDTRIWSYLFMGLTLRLECMDFCDLSNFANQVMVQAGISPSLSEKRLVIHINLL